MATFSYPATPHPSDSNSNSKEYFSDNHSNSLSQGSEAEGRGKQQSEKTAIVSSNQSQSNPKRVTFFQHCAIIPDPPHLLQESKPSVQKRFSFAHRSSSNPHNSSNTSNDQKRNRSSSTVVSQSSSFGSTWSPEQPKLGLIGNNGSGSGSISGSKKSRRTSLDIGGGGGLKMNGNGTSPQEDSNNSGGGKWRIKTLNKLGNVIAAATHSNSNSISPENSPSNEEDKYSNSNEVDAEEFLNSISFRDEIISKIARGSNVIENCKLLEEFENGNGNENGTLKATDSNQHQNSTTKKRKKKSKLKSALRASSQFPDDHEKVEESSHSGLEEESTTHPGQEQETQEVKQKRRLEREKRLQRHDGKGPPIASLDSSAGPSSPSISSPSPSSSPSQSPSPSQHQISSKPNCLITPSGKNLSISLFSGEEDSNQHVKAVETARRLGGLVIPLETECSCKECQSRIDSGLGDNYEPPWSKQARLKYIAGREQAKVLARQRIDAAKRLAERAEIQERQEALYHHGLGGNGAGPSPLVPSWASPNHPSSPVGSRSGTPSIGSSRIGEQFPLHVQKEIPLSTVALTRAAQVNDHQFELETSDQKHSSGDEAGLIAASNAVGLKLELEDDRINSNRTPDVEGPRPTRSSLDLARPSSQKGQDEDYFNSRGLRPPSATRNSSNQTFDSSSDQSPFSESASDSGCPSIVKPSPIRPTGGSFSSSSTSAVSPHGEPTSHPALTPQPDLPPLISNPIDEELVDEFKALRAKAEEAARHRAASPRCRGGARAMMRQLEAAESRESVASIERTRSSNSNRRDANVSSESYASSGWGGISPSPSPRAGREE